MGLLQTGGMGVGDVKRGEREGKGMGREEETGRKGRRGARPPNILA